MRRLSENHILYYLSMCIIYINTDINAKRKKYYYDTNSAIFNGRKQ